MTEETLPPLPPAHGAANNVFTADQMHAYARAALAAERPAAPTVARVPILAATGIDEFFDALAERQAAPTHTDHPSRHWDRTCPACVAESEAERQAAPEPVAWRYRYHSEGKWKLAEEPGQQWAKDLTPTFEQEPLLASPPPAQPLLTDAEAERLTAELDAARAEWNRMRNDVAALHMAQAANNQNHPPAWHDAIDAALEAIDAARGAQ